MGVLVFWNDTLVSIRGVYSHQTQQVKVSLPGLPDILGYPHYSTLRFAIRKDNQESSFDDNCSTNSDSEENSTEDMETV